MGLLKHTEIAKSVKGFPSKLPLSGPPKMVPTSKNHKNDK